MGITRRSIDRLLALLFVTNGSACMEPEYGAVLATVEVSPDDGIELTVEAPSQIPVNTRFTVVVPTVGSGCAKRGPTEVEVSEQQAVVTPFNLEPLRPRNCPDRATLHLHTVEVRFREQGDGTVIVRGWSDVSEDTVQIERIVRVVR